MLKTVKLAVIVCAAVGAVVSLNAYRKSLVESGYDKAVAEYKLAAKKLIEKHDAEQLALKADIKELQNEHQQKTEQLSDYRSKFAATTRRLREQEADSRRKLAEAACGSVRDYASAVTRNFEEARGHVERLGLEAASCAATAETLKKTLDLVNGQGLGSPY